MKYTTDAQFVSLDMIYNRRNSLRFPWQKPMVNISFDDGFKDIYQYAFPIFKKYAIPFTIYLTTDFPDGKANLWWIRLEQIIETHTQIVLSNGQSFACETIEQKQSTYERICKQIYDSSSTPTEAFYVLLASYVVTAKWNSTSYTLSWSELQEMLDSGLLTIGSHTITHPMLTKIDMANIQQELLDSKQRTEQMLPVRVRHFSYPHSAMSAMVEKEVGKAGYLSATLGYGGTIRKNDNPYVWNRQYIIQP
ncbi:MAG: polysaccharide deacetylase family protein [Paludibacteraceae bacterium]